MADYWCKRRSAQRQHFKQLERQRDDLHTQLECLQQRRDALQQQNAMVSALSDSLLHLLRSKEGQETVSKQQEQQPQQNAGTAEDLALQQRVLELRETEGQLLGRLQSLPALPAHEQLAAGCDGQQHPTISPADDPMALMRDFIGRPLPERASSMTAMELTLLFKATVTDIAILLQQLDAYLDLMPPEKCIERMRTKCDRLLHCLAACMLLGRVPVLRAYATTNADTLGEPDAAALTRHTPNVVAAVSKLHLTTAQQQAIANHWEVWRSLLVPVDAEMTQLQQQMQELTFDDISTSQDPACAAAVAARTAVTTTAACAGSAADRAALIESQMRLADRLQVVLRKKGIINLVCVSYVVGRLSWVQVARLSVLSWPFPVSFELLCMAVAQMGSNGEPQEELRLQLRAVEERHANGSDGSSNWQLGTPK